MWRRRVCSKADRGRRSSETNARQSAFADPVFNDGFLLPAAGRVSGVYGSQRFFNGKPKRPHYGLDVSRTARNAGAGDPPGRVTLAESDMYYEGGLVFIDHGLDLISAYLHLSDIKVKAGDYVERGTVIAAIGAGKAGPQHRAASGLAALLAKTAS